MAEIEVGGWPVPEITWFKDGEELVSKTHTENWNGYPNKYVPEASLEVIQVFYHFIIVQCSWSTYFSILTSAYYT